MDIRYWLVSAAGEWINPKTWVVEEAYVEREFERVVEYYFASMVKPTQILNMPRNRTLYDVISGPYQFRTIHFKHTKNEMEVTACWRTCFDGRGSLTLKAERTFLTSSIDLPTVEVWTAPVGVKEICVGELKINED